MHRLKAMKETLVGCVQAQLGDIANADTHELGEAIDMIKDLEEAMYYCSKTKEIEEESKEKEEFKKMKPREYHYYTERMMPYPYERDMDREMGRMYYSENQPRNSQGEFTSYNRRNYQDGQGNPSENSNTHLYKT